ncbi:glycosyltransferase family protein [Brumimicrobium mesophilum]|uniref:hypothetical protein n=1 Tax=Brumimicrobium mesophilum TaxID=392717 RepID=UPI000D13F20C|nr:hypothetical protein [Brumimicrobium mesophilum]
MKKLFLRPEILVFVFTCLIIVGFYHQVIFNLNEVIFAPDGDGIKNYYTYLFHAKYDTNFWDFGGMNYPFYEHIVYTDAQPLLSYFIKIFGLTGYGIGILNFLMLIAFPISAVLIFKLLKHYGVNTIWSVLSGITIALLTPQLLRLTGHFSLSYSFAIPLMWLILIKISSIKGVKWSILLFFILFTAFFTHPYLGLIMSVFGLSYGFVFWYFERGKWKNYLLKIWTPILSVIILFQLMVGLTDSHTDRMKSPSGFFEYYADWGSLLLPHHGPLNSIVQFFELELSEWETWTYLGFFTILIILLAIVFYVINIKSISLKTLFNSPIGKIYLAAHLVLLFSFCFPFKFELFKPIVENVSPIKQFRVLGRFAWVYFYVVSIGGIVFLNYLLNKYYTQKKLIIVFYFLGIAFTILEIIPVHTQTAKTISHSKNSFKSEYLNDDLKQLVDWTNNQEYDAILFLPFTHLSSENIFLMGTEEANYDAMMLSYHTKLPLMNTITSRTSVSEAIQFHNLFSPDYIEKEIYNSIGENKKILLVRNNDDLNKNESRMVEKNDLIFENKDFKAYDFKASDWNESTAFKEVKKQSELAQFDLKNEWRSDTSDVWFVYDGFEDSPQDITLVGNGAFAAQKDKFVILKDNIQFPENGKYKCSFWYNMRVDRVNQMAVIEQEFTNGESSWVMIHDMRKTNLIVGDWARISFELEITDDVVKTMLFFPPNETENWFIVDELLIQKVDDSNLFKEERLNGKDYLIYNNDWIELNSFSE